MCPRYVKKINTDRGLAAATRTNITSIPDVPLNATGSSAKKYSESSHQKSQKAANDINVLQSPAKVAKFDDSLQNLTETNRRLEQLMHKPKSQWTAEDKKLIALTKTLK